MSLQALRAKLLAQENRTQQNQTQSQNIGDKTVYPFWNIPEGSSSTLRFLPDADPDNAYFWVERNMIKLPFVGVKGQNESKQVVVQVPCMEMYGQNEKCPVLAEVRTWYKDKSLEEMANKYWKKRSYIFQGFVRNNGLPDDVTPENPIRRFIVTPQVFKIIKAPLLDPEFTIMPTDYNQGLDFKIVKSKNPGGWAEYVNSQYTILKGPSALTEAERAAIEAHGLFDLKEFLPKKPSDSELRIIKEMFEASVDGRMYDPDRWGAYYKPWGLQAPGATASDEVDEEAPQRTQVSMSVSKPAAKPSVTESKFDSDDEEPASVAEVKTPAATSAKTQDILAMIRSRQSKTA